jgi:molybdate transport system ATP-binding protein
MISVALQHTFPDLLLEVAFSAPTPGTTVLFGPSGAGKSSVVAAIAGLLRGGRSRVEVDGTVLADTARALFLPPERRRIGLVFQEARLFPHLSVAGNLRYGLRRAPPGPIGFDEVVALLGIAALLTRRPHTLSGGERQRVAIGRALLCQPLLLLLDEPLASLDGPRKAEILPFLTRLKTALALPIVYVTHALDELFYLADTVVLIECGRVLAAGPLAELSARADLPLLAARDEAGAVLSAKVAAHDLARRLTRLQAGGLKLSVPLLTAPPGTTLRLVVPAREVILARAVPEAVSVQNIIAGRVRAVREDPVRPVALVEVVAEGAALLARVTPDAVARLQLAVGTPVLALIKSMSVDVLDG